VLKIIAPVAVSAGAIVAWAATSEPDAIESWRLAARYSARFSFLVFMPVYVARAWHALAPSRASRAALANRRALGLAFAAAHFIHFFALMRFTLASGTMPDLPTLVGGGGAYLILAAMTLTSHDAAVKRLGARTWKRLHTVGIHWLWFVFAFSYFGRVVSGRLAFLPLLLLALGGLAARVAVRFRGHASAG
jgi:sulfoxide reductase heme-binding subunit YedZ